MHVQSAREISRVKSMEIFRKFKHVKIAQNWPLTFGLHFLGGKGVPLGTMGYGWYIWENSRSRAI